MSLRIAKFALGAPPYVLTAVLPLRGEEDATTVRPPFLDALNITLLALASLENEYIFWEGSPGHIYVEKCTRQCALLDKDTCAQITTLTRKPWQLYASSSAWSRLCVDVEGWRKSDGPGSLKALQEEADSLEVNLGSVVSFAPALPMIEAPPMSPATLPTPPPTQPTLAEPAPGIGSAPAANPVASSSTVSVRPSPATCVPAATKRRAEDVGEGTPKAKRARKKSVIRVPRLHDVKWRSAYGGVFMDEDGNGRAACIITEEPGLRQFKTTYKRGDFVIIAKPQDCTDTFAWVARITGFEYASGQAPVGRIETILASIQWFNPVGDNESREIRFSGFQDVPLLAFDALTNVAKLDSRNPTLPLLRESDRFIKKSSSTMFENSRKSAARPLLRAILRRIVLWVWVCDTCMIQVQTTRAGASVARHFSMSNA
ncbi:hypothetical protein CYLTODRAFT_86840 [Cylindrobasidium torrendii FP15055 ss-10]|uniref:BAH domain-containing protein n=1 Tax=Cylindrobasidium torrendii FP15055 ss-10 TaxID=1314674 RepID=A0A0D7BNZ1_9AGAR|nr:hypothetical protein CYLTODRAFT_86840 [Cylindrobasidium torrendii FP15055 ss-10]